MNAARVASVSVPRAANGRSDFWLLMATGSSSDEESSIRDRATSSKSKGGRWGVDAVDDSCWKLDRDPYVRTTGANACAVGRLAAKPPSEHEVKIARNRKKSGAISSK